ncbi:MAG TPA: HAMP domain-containing protein, partial [Armatimonadetes bacterium]|nr:HAMP domain-containing protein [Armatimonadota bacterium]
VVFYSLAQIGQAVEIVRLAEDLGTRLLKLENYQTAYAQEPSLTERRRINREWSSLEELIHSIQRLKLHSEEQRSFEVLWHEYRQTRQSLRAFLEADASQRKTMLGSLRRLEEQMRRRARGLATTGRSQVAAATQMAKGLIAVAFVAMTLIALWLGIRLALGISEPVRELVRLTNAIAEGDLQQHLDLSRRDELGHLARSFNRMTQKLREAQARLRATMVSKRLLGELIHDLGQRIEYSEAVMFATGQQFANRLAGSLQEFLTAFADQGLGRLELESVNPEEGEALFRGYNLFESTKPADYPQDHFTRGFLAQVLSQLVEEPMNCEEIACAAQGADYCQFMVFSAQGGIVSALARLDEIRVEETPAVTT